VRPNNTLTPGGGLNQPRDALGVAAWALLTHPDQRAAVEADPALWPTVLDEALRWVAPIGLYSRQTTRDVDLAGVRLPAGARLGICVLSANRDESVWGDAAAFDVRREVKPHLAFSKGVHVCLGAWVARAEVASVGLPRLFERLRGLDLVPDEPAEIGGWVFRGMTRMPVRWDAQAAPERRGASSALSERAADVSELRARVAIVGAGPAGCFTAQALRRALPGCTLDVLDDLPVPYGLVRYGVAADHQGTKSVTRQFERLFADPSVSFHGNTRLGTHVTLDELRGAYDAVVLATGVHTDASLPVPGADHARVHGAGRITRLLNGHPDETVVPELGEELVVVGHGNVAMDVVRLVARRADDLDGTDVDDATRERLVGNVRVVHVVGRSAPETARFDPVMVREIAGLPGVAHRVHGADLGAVAPGKDARLDAVRDLVAAGEDDGARVRVEWWFGLAPEGVGDGDDGRLSVRFRGPADAVTLRGDDVVTAIGFVADAGSPAAPGTHEDGRVEPGLYVAGWLRTGPRGTIPDQRTHARALATTIADDLRSGARPGARTGLARHGGATDFDGWRRIDLRERLGAAPGRDRAKLRTRAELLAASRDVGLELPARVPEDTARFGAAGPVTVLFGTESGGAEMVADDLRRALGDDAEVRDLANTRPEDLDPARVHVVVCATYGDGEVPTSARPFHRALVERRPNLAGLRYAVFGMGDRSYTRTYSRGSELVDEALAACGGRRFGEYGRHDAGGPVEAADAALEWLDGVLAEAAAPAPV
jgi:flavodoxin